MTMSRLSQNSLAPQKVIPWASFSNTPTGSFTDASGYTWSYVSFTASGTLTITQDGLLDILCIGGGGGGGSLSNGGAGGGAGAMRWGIFQVTAQSATITIGAGGGTTSDGSATSIGSILRSGGGMRGITQAAGRWNGFGGGGSAGGRNGEDPNQSHVGGGAGGFTYGASDNAGISLNYTGSTIEYASAVNGTGSGAANTGQGGGFRASNGGSGIVVVRVRTN